MKDVEFIGEEGNPAVHGDGRAFATAAIVKGLAAVESIVASVAPLASGLFAAGTTSPSLADICLVPQIYNAKRFNIDLSSYPTIMSIVSRCEQLPGFQESCPESQPDCQL